METKDRLDRVAPLSGVAFVVLQVAGVIVGASSGRSMAALGDPMSKIVKSFHDPVGTGVWIGAYLELASIAAFAVFAVWLLRSQTGVARIAGLAAAATYVAVTVTALVAGDALAYGAGHGLSDQSLLALFYLQSGLFFATWGIAGMFLLLVPAAGWLRRTAVAIAALLLIALAFPTSDPSQTPNMLFMIWTLAASIALARRSSDARQPRVAAAAV